VPCPVTIANPVGDAGEYYALGSLYGVRVHPVTGETSFHAGIDIPAPMFTNVRAILPGAVTVSRTGERAGQYLVVEHDNGMKSRYFHLSHRLVSVGERVRAGDIIGTVGQSGQVTGPHLHLEIYDSSGNRFDPEDCYLNSIRLAPYGYVAPVGSQDVPDENGFNWVPWAIGGGVLLIGGIIIFGIKRRN